MSIFTNKYFWLHIMLAILLAIGLFFGLQWWLKSLTSHGETLSVPNLRGLTESQVAEILAEKELRYVISDSIYHPKAGKQAVIEQDPEPDMLVKKHRTIYLTINASSPPKVKLPDLRDLSLRQATATLETFGFRTGRLIYVPDIAYNAVLGQQVNGEDVNPGTELEKGTVVDLILGEGISGELVPVPDVTGLFYQEALDAIRAASFNPGAVIGDPSTPVVDTLRSKVYRQSPAGNPDKYQHAGKSIDIWITEDFAKAPSRAPADDSNLITP